MALGYCLGGPQLERVPDGFHVHNEFPQRFRPRSSKHIPDRISNSTSSDVDDTLFRTNPSDNDRGLSLILRQKGGSISAFVPAELRVCGEVSPRLAHIGEEFLDLPADDAICNIVNCLANLGKRDRSCIIPTGE